MSCSRLSAAITGRPSCAARTAASSAGSGAFFGTHASAPPSSAAPMPRAVGRAGQHDHLPARGGQRGDELDAVEAPALVVAAEVEVEQHDARARGATSRAARRRRHRGRRVGVQALRRAG